MDLEKIIIKTLIEYQFGDNLKTGEYITGVKKMYFGQVAADVVRKYNDIHNVSELATGDIVYHIKDGESGIVREGSMFGHREIEWQSDNKSYCDVSLLKSDR